MPVYGTRFTLGLVKERLQEHGIEVPLIEIYPREPFGRRGECSYWVLGGDDS